jgi:uncharacterized protein YraI
MQINKKALGAAIAGLAMIASTASAFAAPAVATGSVNVRTGPSTQYQRVDTLQRNEVVEVTGCRGGWCYVEKRGADGWVSANYLKAVAVQSQRQKPSVSFSINFGNAPVVRPPRHHENRGPGQGHGRDWHHDRNNSGFSFQFGN